MPMMLKDQRGEGLREFELALIEEDDLPELQDGDADSGALAVSFRVAVAGEEWEETAPLINLYELRNLLEWLESLASGSPDTGEVDVLEPALNFSVLEQARGTVTVRIRFALERRPDWAQLDSPTDEASHVDITMTRGQVAAAAAQLRADLDGLEPRGDGPEKS